MCGLTLVGAHAGGAESLRGQVDLPAAAQEGRRYRGFWRMENGSVPVKPPPASAAPIVFLSGPEGTPPAAKTVEVKIAGFAAEPKVVVVGPGSVVEIRNEDKTHHDLSIPGQETVMPLERLGSKNLRRQKFALAGVYEIRSAEHPHLAISVIVAENPYFASCDAKGAFKMDDVPNGTATLKVHAGGRIVHTERVEISAARRSLRIKVETRGAAEAAAD
jgi:plastocyanin